MYNVYTRKVSLSTVPITHRTSKLLILIVAVVVPCGPIVEVLEVAMAGRDEEMVEEKGGGGARKLGARGLGEGDNTEVLAG